MTDIYRCCRKNIIAGEDLEKLRIIFLNNSDALFSLGREIQSADTMAAAVVYS